MRKEGKGEAEERQRERRNKKRVEGEKSEWGGGLWEGPSNTAPDPKAGAGT